MRVSGILAFQTLFSLLLSADDLAEFDDEEGAQGADTSRNGQMGEAGVSWAGEQAQAHAEKVKKKKES